MGSDFAPVRAVPIALVNSPALLERGWRRLPFSIYLGEEKVQQSCCRDHAELSSHVAAEERSPWYCFEGLEAQGLCLWADNNGAVGRLRKVCCFDSKLEMNIRSSKVEWLAYIVLMRKETYVRVYVVLLFVASLRLAALTPFLQPLLRRMSIVSKLKNPALKNVEIGFTTLLGWWQRQNYRREKAGAVGVTVKVPGFLGQRKLHTVLW